MLASPPVSSMGRTPHGPNSEGQYSPHHELVESSSNGAGVALPAALPPVRSIRVLLPQFFGMYVSYTVYALLYESIIKHPGFLYPFSFALTVVQYAIYATLSYIRLSFFHSSPIPSPHGAPAAQGKAVIYSAGPGSATTSTQPSRLASILGVGAEGVSSWRFVLIAFLTFLSSSLTSFGCHRLPYPLLVMLKSCKVLPTVIVGRTLFGTRYRRAEIAAVGLLTLGAALAAADAVLFTHPHAVPRAAAVTTAPAGANVAVAAGGGLMRLRATAISIPRADEPSAAAIASAAAEFVPFPSAEAATAAIAASSSAPPATATPKTASMSTSTTAEKARQRLRRARMSALSQPHAAPAVPTASSNVPEADGEAGSRYTLTTDDAAATIAASEGDYSFSASAAPHTEAAASAAAATTAATASTAAPAHDSTEEPRGGMRVHWPTLIGVLALIGSLGSDALTNNLLEDTLARARVPPAAVIFRVKSTAAVCAATAAVASGCLPALWDYLCARPEVLRLVLAFGICGWAGESCLMAIVSQWGAVLGTALAAGRKMGTVVLSMLIFPKRKGPAFLAGVGIVFLGVGLQVAAKAAKGDKHKLKGQTKADTPLQGPSASAHCAEEYSDAETDVESARDRLEMGQISKGVASACPSENAAPLASLGLSIAAPAPPALRASLSSASSGPSTACAAGGATGAAADSRSSGSWRWEVAAAGILSPAAVAISTTPAPAPDHDPTSPQDNPAHASSAHAAFNYASLHGRPCAPPRPLPPPPGIAPFATVPVSASV